MIKTLRFTAIISGIAALAVIVLVVYPMVAGHGIDESVKAFLESPGVVELFKSKGGGLAKSEAAKSPLIEEAERFGLYLDPPVKVEVEKITRGSIVKPPVELPRPPVVSAKFKVIMTSYSSSRPELSRAMINQPGKGIYWVKEKSKVGHLEIEKIKDGSIVVKDSSSSYEIEVPQKEPFTLLRSKQVSDGPQDTTEGSAELASLVGKDANAVPGEITGRGDGKVQPAVNPNVQKLREAMLKNRPGKAPGNAVDQQKRMEELMSVIETMRMKTQEAENVRDLGNDLQEESKKESPQEPVPPKRPRPVRKPPTKSDK